MKNKYDLFISYSRADLQEVTELLDRLKKEIPGLTYWFDITGIESASEFEDKIISAIANSSFVLFALSDNSMLSEWTKDEITYAKNIGKKVIPILLKGACLKEGWFLFKFGRIDCIDSTNKIQFMKLVRDLSNWLTIPTNEQNTKKELKLIRPNNNWKIIICIALIFSVIGIFIIKLNNHKLDIINEDQNNYEAMIAEADSLIKADSLITHDDIERCKALCQSALFYEIKYADTKYKDLFNFGAQDMLAIADKPSANSNKNIIEKPIDGEITLEQGICYKCSGTGKSETSIEISCTKCNGTGVLTNAAFTERGQLIYQSIPCNMCHGLGKVTSDSCRTCDGTGYIHKTVTDESIQSTIDIQSSITIDCFRDSWIAMRTPYEDYYAYHSKKVSTDNKALTELTMSITIKGYANFTFYINSDSESNYDYVMVGDLNNLPARTSNYSNTKGKGKSSLNFYSYKPVTFSNLDKNQFYTIYVVYTKDANNDKGEDCGYVLIPKSK